MTTSKSKFKSKIIIGGREYKYHSSIKGKHETQKRIDFLKAAGWKVRTRKAPGLAYYYDIYIWKG